MTQAESVFKEFRNWCFIVEKEQDPSKREQMARILNEIELVYLQMSRLDISSLGSLSEAFSILDTTSQAVDRLWTSCPLYSAEQVSHFLNLISIELERFVLEQLENFNVFDNGPESRNLSLCYQLVSKWLHQTNQFTVKLWPSFSARKWTSGVFKSEKLENIHEKLTFFDQYQRSYFFCAKFMDSYLAPQFPAVTECFEMDNETWDRSTLPMLSGLESMANVVFLQIENGLKQMGDNQDALADELLSLKFLTRYSVVAKGVAPYEAKRNKLFLTYLDLLRKQATSHYADEVEDPNAICDSLKWYTYQLRYSKDFKAKCPKDESIDAAYQAVVTEFEKAISDMMAAWTTAISKQLSSINFDENMIKHESNAKTRIMLISFPTDKESILQQESVILSLNFRIAHEIDSKLRKLREHRQYFCALKQAVDYFNTTVISIIRPLRPLLMTYVDGFISSFQGIQSVQFTQQNEVETFIANVIRAADDLYENNEQLMAIHRKIISDISALFDCSLLAAENRWKETLRVCRNQMVEIYRGGKTNLKMWLKHLNSQVYKALDYQFEKTLMTMESDAQEITVNLSYSRPDLIFEPSISSLRVQLYQQINRLVAIPTHFAGVTFQATTNEFTAQFAGIVKYHLTAIDQLYKRTEVLISRVSNCAEKFNDWTVLGQIPDFDAAVNEKLTDQKNFLTNLNGIAMREQQIERIPDSEKFDFITVNYVIAKNAFRRLVGEYKRAVCALLRKSLENDISYVMDFINNSLASIQTTIQSSDEVKRVKETIASLHGKISEVSANFKNIHNKSNLLMIHDPQSRQSVQFQIDSISSHWAIFKGALTDQNKVVQQQLRTLRTLMNQKIEDFQRRTTNFKVKWEERKPKEIDFKNSAAVEKAIQVVKETRIALVDFEKEKEMLLEEEKGFGVSKQRAFQDIADVAASLNSFETTWLLLDRWQTELEEISVEDWVTYRSHIYDLKDFLDQWNDYASRVPPSDVSMYLIEKIRDYITYYPDITLVRGDNWTAEHWEELGIILKYPKPMKINELKLSDILANAAGIHKNVAKIRRLGERAKGEGTIRAALREVREWNMHTDFVLFEQQGISVIKEWKDLLTQVSDMQATIQSLSSLQFADAFESEIQLWTTKFTTLHEALLLLNQIQRKWLHLAPIFNSGALPSHTEKFNSLDTQFKGIMGDIKKDPQVTSLLNKYDIVSTLKGILEGLDQCQSALTAFLESKRQGFPRLYFIGDFDLLEILGKVRENPNIVQTHLKNLFQGISSVEIDSDNKVVAYCSSLGEKVYLPEPVFTTGSVEMWLNELCEKMQNTLTDLLNDYMTSNAFSTKHYPSQIVQVGEGIKFVSECEHSIQKHGLDGLSETYKKKLLRLAEFRTNPLNDEGQPPSVKVDITESSETSLIKCLIMDHVNYNSVITDLSSKSIVNTQAFEWMRRFKYYFVDGKCIVKMCDGVFDYGYEYQGNAPKLVHTPLTDLCWSTLCEGMHLGFAGNPYGPAGTGKTESVKALGQAMGRQVLVFNCGDGIDVKSICRIFTGLVQCGAWGCFDEFNRLDELVLSAVSQQIQEIQTAILKKSETVSLLSKTVHLNLKSGIFVTLNPAGKAYGGRSKLPNNLKALFRSVSMSVPDKNLIAQVMLYSEGFHKSDELAQRMVTVFSLADQLLSKQKHYDWGLRAQKTVLNMAGQWLRNSSGNEDEEQIIIRALLFDTLGKLDDKDRRLFLDIVKDIFKTDQNDNVSENSLESTVIAVLEEMKLQQSKSQMTKISLLNQLIQHRTGAVIVGPAGCGKSTVWKVLAEALTKSGKKTTVWHIVPKAVPLEGLMGSIDMDTREWTDGVLTRAARAASRLEPDEMGFIVCDGDVDPVWIESLNSVLDDNRLLTLPTGERIQFDRNVKFIFETHSLQFASPATVSRMGVLFVNRTDFDIKLTFPAFIADKDKAFSELFTSLVPPALELIQQYSPHFVFSFTDLQILRNIIPHIQGITQPIPFMLAIAKACASLISPSHQEKFAQAFMKNAAKICGAKLPSMKAVLTSEWIDGQISAFQSAKIGEDEWNSSEPPFVSTPESLKFVASATPFVTSQEPLLIAGPKGCGKTVLVKKLYPGDVEYIYCNALTTAKSVMTRLNELCNTAPGANGLKMKPRSGKPLTLFFKGVQNPNADKFDTVELHSFIRQLCQLNGYMNESLDWVELSNIYLVASIDPSDSLQPLSERFLSQFRVIVVDYVSSESLRFIYGEYLTNVLHRDQQWDWNSPQVCYELAKSLIVVYDQFLSSNGFTPKDLTQWVIGVLRYADDQPTLSILYEACRVFADRLPANKQKEFNQTLTKNISGKLGVYTTFAQNDNLLRRTDISSIKKSLNGGLTSYERECGPLDIFIQNSTMKLSSQINRAIALPCNHLLLIAVTGCGAKEVLKLTVHTMKGKLFSPSTFDGYSLRHFAIDLKECISYAANENKIAVFCIEEYQIIDNSFFDYINALLTNKIPPNLYTPEEQKAILSQLNDISYEEFKKIVRDNLRIVVVIDPRSPTCNKVLKAQPLLEAQCTILKVNDYEEKVLAEMTPLILSKLEINDETIAKLPFAKVHKTLKMQSSDFQTLIRAYVDLSKKKAETLATRKKFLADGLLRLKAVSDRVSQLSKEAEVQQVQVREKEQRAKEAMDEISKTMTELNIQSEQMDKIKGELSSKEEDLKKKKAKIDDQLSGILPLLQAASENVAKLDSRDLSEVKSFTMPPQQVRDVLEAVLLLMGERDTSWQNIRKYFSNPRVKEEILRFDPKSVSQQSITDVNKAIDKKKNSFDYETVRRSSAAAAPLAEWVKAMAQYCLVLRDVQPLQNELDKCDHELESSRTQLKHLEEKKKELDNTVTKLQDQYREFTSEAERLRLSLNEIEDKQKSASSLLNKLSDEQKRWSQQHSEIEAEQGKSTQKLLLSAAFITICGSLNETDRTSRMSQLAKALEIKDDFNFKDFINTQSEILELKFNGFPSDELSLENVQIIKQCENRTLFVIDPTEYIVEWLEHSLGPAAEILSWSHPRFQHQATLAIRFGKKLIVKESDGVPLCLIPYLAKEFVISNGHLTVRVGDKFIDVHPEFRLIIVTRNSAIELTPREQSLVTTVNFTVTRTALRMQLLTLALGTENPEIEQKHQEQLNESEQLKIELGNLESSLLDILAAADPNTILSNKELINSLDEKKKRANEVEQRLKAVEKFQEQIQEKRVTYQPLANVASAIYFNIDTLYLVHTMYRFSLNEFTKLYISSFKECKASGEGRVKGLIKTFNSIAYSHFSRALFREHRLVFGMNLVKTIYPRMFPDNEWQQFLHQRPAKAEIPSFIPSERQPAFMSLAANVPKVVETLKFAENAQAWTQWLDCASPDNPSSWPTIDGKNSQQLGITALERCLVLQALRPDRLLSGIERLVTGAFSDPKVLSLRQLLTAKDGEYIFVFIVTPGSDPSIELKEIANEIPGVKDNLVELALGECDAKDALSLVRQAARNDQWAIIKNVHLDISFLQQLEKLVPSLGPNENFKLILTTEATPSFPTVLLQNSSKIAYEAPPGLINQMSRTLTMWSEDWFAKQKKDVQRSLISLAYLHGVLQERRAFIPVGWSQFFEFTQADLNAATQIIEQRNDATDVVRGLLQTTVYGSRMDSEYDRRVLNLFVKNNFPCEKFQLFDLPSDLTIKAVSKLLSQRGKDESAENGPTTLGLCSNASATVARSQMESTIRYLSALSSATASEAEGGTPVFQLVTQLSSQFPSVLEEVNVSLQNHPAIDFISVQRSAAHALLKVVTSDIEALSAASDAAMLPAHLRSASAALKKNAVPAEWACDWIDCDDVDQWIEELFQRTAALDAIAVRIRDHSVLTSQPLPLYSTMRPGAFISAMMQTAVRMNRTEMNAIKIVATFDRPANDALMSLNICDLVLQAGAVKGGTVTTSDTANNDVFKLDKVYLSICPLSGSSDKALELPIFESLTREKLVAKAEVPSDSARNQVILASAALVLSH
ncbi:Cytoplasmic dynein 2 heavy chain 1 [Tritrichomonas foetus]|uniref:Cytoplasmic dynein 2 heavy chain 1 n=1 Tax=Tritrichomonas foetus TaxID=1144522 RepID=A0A1J4JPH7_9EUKA|nr:cytoplasmic dynein 2 heavy chain 1 [Tritrichomonas foetus]OHT00931.1 Cytoplasmic dynein 2 heavy chain 1 [Tritrichomonas foetus]|eukprot:OHT00931.1 Cytoplasmic dynein 2 heavy chain 1 [Tritrichomonas foetus]